MLYLCATPIGNMEDITLRVLRVLNEVDAIYAEDTRHSGILLAHHCIQKPLISCHEHNEAERAVEIVERLRNGDNIAYISDAGMPCVSDPGERLVRACIEGGVEYTVLPGASASVTALALSGLSAERFFFYGFLPRSGADRKEALELLAQSTVSSIIYESPNRIYSTLCDLAEYAGEGRAAVVVRELTKIYEQAVRGSLSELREKYAENAPKGECVIILAGRPEGKASVENADDMINALLAQGLKAKAVAKTASELLGISKNEVYNRVLELSGKKE